MIVNTKYSGGNLLLQQFNKQLFFQNAFILNESLKIIEVNYLPIL